MDAIRIVLSFDDPGAAHWMGGRKVMRSFKDRALAQEAETRPIPRFRREFLEQVRALARMIAREGLAPEQAFGPHIPQSAQCEEAIQLIAEAAEDFHLTPLELLDATSAAWR